MHVFTCSALHLYGTNNTLHDGGQRDEGPLAEADVHFIVSDTNFVTKLPHKLGEI